MADPTASFVITARDATSAAIASADKNLKSLQRTAMAAKNIFATFGLAVGGRIFANWIKGAIEAKDVTAEQAEQLKGAKDALEAYRRASQDLAVSFATQLTPAISGAAAVLTGWNRILFNADPFPFEKQIRDVEDALRDLEKQGADTGIGFSVYTPEQQAQMAKLKGDIEDLKKLQSQAMESRGRALRNQELNKFAEGLELDIRSMGLKHIELPIALQLQTMGPFSLQQQLDDGLEELIVEPAELPVALQLDQMPTKAEIEQALKPLDESLIEAGETLGRGLRDSLVDFLVEGELRFRDFLKRLAAEFLVSQLFSAFSSVLGGKGGFLSGLFGGGKATGGPAEAGMVYRVHKGEAFFTPGESGFIGPVASGSGAAVYVTNHNTYYGTPPADAARHQAETIRRIRADLKNERERGRS